VSQKLGGVIRLYGDFYRQVSEQRPDPHLLEGESSCRRSVRDTLKEVAAGCRLNGAETEDRRRASKPGAPFSVDPSEVISGERRPSARLAFVRQQPCGDLHLPSCVCCFEVGVMHGEVRPFPTPEVAGRATQLRSLDA